MKNENILDAIGMINEEAVRDAKAYQRPKSRNWFKWGAMAACLCLVVVGAFSLIVNQRDPSVGMLEGNIGSVDQVYTLSQPEKMSVELVEWGKKDRFKGIVVDVGNNTIFPANAELSVVFDYDTEIILEDDTSLMFNPDEPDIDAIGWDSGTIVYVEFLNYSEYQEGNHFYNQVYARLVQKAEYEVIE